jgi:ABC-type Mn2+/Zn2+ transport system ATPase subunit
VYRAAQAETVEHLDPKWGNGFFSIWTATYRGSARLGTTMESDEACASDPTTAGPQGDLEIAIKDCNSITEARLSLRRSSLNIKYGPNGIGKSTIAQALLRNSQGGGAMDELIPFKYRDGKEHPKPSVVGANEIKKLLVFDETYISQFAFQRDEVLKNSFEIFINTDDYRQGLADIASLFDELRETVSQRDEFDEAIASFTELRDVFGVTKSGAISKTSRGWKALAMGAKLIHIPEPLQGYEGFLQSNDPASWITWQSKGKDFLEMSDNCPFCSIVSVNKETARQVSAEYESAAVKNMSALRAVIDRLGSYFTERNLELLNKVTTTVGDLSPEQSQFLAAMRGDVETLLNKFTALRALSFHALQAEENVDEVLRGLKVNLSLLSSLDSETTQALVAPINEKLDVVAGRINDIRRGIGKQKKRVADLIKANQDDINEFLDSAGYRYSVRIEQSADSYRMILEHKDAPGHLESASSHLSYGERNAFALVLFMHQVRKDKPDLVVLDDPVSSFDKTKKFAILHQLFHGKTSIREFTTLLLTHDIEPAIDIVITATRSQFLAAKPVAYFLRSHGGTVTEKAITRRDISTFSQVCDKNIALSTDDLIKCIYLRRRYEVHGALGPEYDVLSSLLHLRTTPDRKVDGEEERVPLDPAVIAAATSAIKEFIPAFDYAATVRELNNPSVLKAKFDATNVGYEKLQIFRVMSQREPEKLKGDNAFKKFVNESYHIENEYVMQLNPKDFDAVPEYVIEACSALLGQAAEGI